MSKRKSLSPEDAPLDAAPGLFKPTEPPLRFETRPRAR